MPTMLTPGSALAESLRQHPSVNWEAGVEPRLGHYWYEDGALYWWVVDGDIIITGALFADE